MGDERSNSIHREAMERIARNMFEIRRHAGFSQELLAQRSGLHRTEISLIERGRRVPRIDTLLKIAGSLETPIEAFVEGVKWVPFSPSDPGMFSLC
jgi:transcriptional regulator with XRE-family HTH domain